MIYSKRHTLHSKPELTMKVLVIKQANSAYNGIYTMQAITAPTGEVFKLILPDISTTMLD